MCTAWRCALRPLPWEYSLTDFVVVDFGCFCDSGGFADDDDDATVIELSPSSVVEVSTPHEK